MKTTTSPTSLLDKVAATIAKSADSWLSFEDWRNEACSALLVIADAVEQRGAKGLDLDPGETADWLRSEANPTNQADY